MSEVKLPPMDLPGNSDTDKESDTKVRMVVQNGVKARKKGFMGRIKEILFADDIENVKEYAITDVIIPGLKNLIVDSVAMLVQGSAYSGRRRDRDERVSYSTKYKYGDRDRDDRKDRRRRREEKEEVEYDEIIFRTISDAEAVLDELYDLLKKNDYVSLKDFYDISGYKSSVFDDNWGWDNLDGVRPKRCREGYYLTLSKPYPLDSIN